MSLEPRVSHPRAIGFRFWLELMGAACSATRGTHTREHGNMDLRSQRTEGAVQGRCRWHEIHMKSSRSAALASLLACLAATWPAFAASQAASSCDPPAWPSSALAGTPPNIAGWPAKLPPVEWSLPACLGWELPQFESFAAAVGTFRAADIDAVLGRIGAISTFKGLRYWSVTDQQLRPLVLDAFAVEGAGLKNPRVDFTPMEMQAGRDLFFLEHDNRTSEPVLYRMRVIARGSDRLVIDIENASRLRWSLLTVFEPGDLRTALFVSGGAQGSWTCYALAGWHPRGLAGLFENHKSYINRLVAFYGHVTQSDDLGLPWSK